LEGLQTFLFSRQKSGMVFLSPHWRPRRSVLYVPASNLRAMTKAAGLSCDGVILDLEDSVAAAMAGEARANLRAADRASFGKRELVVRVSSLPSTGFDEDLAAALAIRPDAVLLPKVEDADSVRALSARLASAGSDARIWAMVETPKAVLEVGTIAAADPRLAALVIGPNDLAKATGVPMMPGRMAFIPWFMMVVAAARAYGLSVLDGVYNQFRDIEGFAGECRQAVSLGFDGKTLIHPGQVEAANMAFSPTAEDYATARRIVEAFALPQNRGLGAIALDGVKVERLHLESAERLLQLEGRFAT
jgi:citrate lyase subunit beta/citryl-CoA lyase